MSEPTFEDDLARLQRIVARLQRHLESPIFVKELAVQAATDASTVIHRLADRWANAEEAGPEWAERLDAARQLCEAIEAIADP